MRPAGGLLPLQHSEFDFFTRTHVRFGSKADIAVRLRDVRFTPESGHLLLTRSPHLRWQDSETC
jgi:hypothetical protein